MKITDITGPVKEGMWDFGFPGGQFKLKALNYDFMGDEYLHEGFEGLVGSTGTFMETGATALGYDKVISVDKIPLERLVNINAYVLQAPLEGLKEKDDRKYVSLEDIKTAEKDTIRPGSAILISTGWGKNWFEKDYLAKSPFFKKDALDYLLDKEPVLISSDFPSWENTLDLEGFLPRLYNSGVFVLVSVVNLEKIQSYNVKLTALPIKVIGVCMCPARAVIIEE
jgi:kynurenine formamidase